MFNIYLLYLYLSWILFSPSLQELDNQQWSTREQSQRYLKSQSPLLTTPILLYYSKKTQSQEVKYQLNRILKPYQSLRVKFFILSFCIDTLKNTKDEHWYTSKVLMPEYFYYCQDSKEVMCYLAERFRARGAFKDKMFPCEFKVMTPEWKELIKANGYMTGLLEMRLVIRGLDKIDPNTSSPENFFKLDKLWQEQIKNNLSLEESVKVRLAYYLYD